MYCEASPLLCRELEDALDAKTAQLITLRKAATTALARWAGAGGADDATLQAALRAVPADAWYAIGRVVIVPPHMPPPTPCRLLLLSFFHQSLVYTPQQPPTPDPCHGRLPSV